MHRFSFITSKMLFQVQVNYFSEYACFQMAVKRNKAAHTGLKNSIPGSPGQSYLITGHSESGTQQSCRAVCIEPQIFRIFKHS